MTHVYQALLLSVIWVEAFGIETLLDSGWYYSLSQQIYTSDEIGMAGYISSIAFEYIVNESFSMEGVQVYMKNVSKSYFESVLPIPGISLA